MRQTGEKVNRRNFATLEKITHLNGVNVLSNFEHKSKYRNGQIGNCKNNISNILSEVLLQLPSSLLRRFTWETIGQLRVAEVDHCMTGENVNPEEYAPAESEFESTGYKIPRVLKLKKMERNTTKYLHLELSDFHSSNSFWNDNEKDEENTSNQLIEPAESHCGFKIIILKVGYVFGVKYFCS